jgi:putative hydrolase of the HAD superfamily
MDMPLPKAILFDLDDTVLATSKGAEDDWRTVCEDVHSRINGISPERLHQAIREHRDWYWSDPVRHHRGRLNPMATLVNNIHAALEGLGLESSLHLAEDMAFTWRGRRQASLKPFPGALEALRALRGSGVRLGMLTNGSMDMQRSKIERAGLTDFFDYIQIEGEFGAGKPEREAYLHALDRLGSTPSQAWMAGDSLEMDVAAAQAVGLHGIWVDHLQAGLPEYTRVRPDRIVQAISELVGR